MAFFDRFFRSAGGGSVISAKCPMCGKAGKLRLDAEARELRGAFEPDGKTQLHVRECPCCTAGMLLCTRDGRLISIEPFTDDPPMDGLAALARTRAKLGM